MECRGEANGGDRVTVDLAVGELFTSPQVPLFCVYDVWGHTDREAQLPAPLGVVRRVHLAKARIFLMFFFYSFTEFDANL